MLSIKNYFSSLAQNLVSKLPLSPNIFTDNNAVFSIHFVQDKKKSVLFGTKHKLRNAKSLNIVYNGIKNKQLGCILAESLSSESMALNIIDKINSHLKFLHRQNHFLPPLIKKLTNV